VFLNKIYCLALGIEIPITYLFMVIPLIYLTEALPISINGLGVREGAFVFFFAQKGISNEEALAAGILVISVRYVFAMLIGGTLFLLEVIRLRGRQKEIGEYKKAKDHYRKSALITQQAEMGPSRINANKSTLALAMVMDSERNVDLKSLYDLVGKIKWKIYESIILRCIGQILLHIDNKDISKAEDWIIKAIEVDHKNSMMWELGRDYALYAEFFKRKGDQSKARENLNKAIEIFKECGADGWVKRYEEELAQL